MLPGGRTAHSRFKIQIELSSSSVCYISGATITQKTDLIIWDEAPASDRYVFECVDRSLQEALENDSPFGGIPCVFSGDWQQILPVVARGARFQIVSRCFKRSYLWVEFETMTLTLNMRILNRSADESAATTAKAKKFHDFLTEIGQGTHKKHPKRGQDIVEIPAELVSEAKSMNNFIDEIYDGLNDHMGDADYFAKRGIVCTRNSLIDEINEKVRGHMKLRAILSADTVGDEDDESKFPDEVLNAYTPSGLPPHALYIEPGTPLMSLRNIDPAKGVCNGTRLIAMSIHRRVILCTIMTGAHKGEKVIVPRMNLSSKKGTYAFQLHRRQFPVRPAYAMTINKSQGQSFGKIGICLPKKVWTHGQLYVALSRAGSSDDVHLYIQCAGDAGHCMRTPAGTFTRNVVYNEVL